MRIREDWPLWIGLGAAAWWFFGGVLLKSFLTGVPILVIGGAVDIVTRPEASEAIAHAVGASVAIVDDVNHTGFLERFEIYHEEIHSLRYLAARWT